MRRLGSPGGMRLSSWRRARRAGRNGDSRARPSGPALGTRGPTVWQVTRVGCSGGQAAVGRYSVSTSAGVLHASGLRGRPFSAAATAARSSSLWRARSVPRGEILAQQPVGVLVGGALPGAAWITEIDLKAGVESELDVLGHLDPLVPGQRPPQLVGKGPDRVSDRVANRTGPGTRDRR